MADFTGAFDIRSATARQIFDKKDADLNNYVTQKALDGLFLIIAEEEKRIRKDPVGSASSIISKVFGAIGK